MFFLQVWVGLLTPRYPESVESSWHQACGQKLSERLSKVCTRNLHAHDMYLFSSLSYIFSPSLPSAVEMQLTFELQLQVLGFCKSHKAPEALVKILLDTAVNAFAKCSVSH